MNTTRFGRSLLLVFLLALAAVANAASDAILARGFNAHSTFHLQDFDSVNVFNGNLLVHVPLGQEYVTNGSLRYGFQLTYNSHVWDYYNQSAVGSLQYSIHLSYINSLFQIDPSDLPTGGGTDGTESVPYGNAGIGWWFSLGDLRGTRDVHPGTQGISYVAPDGSEVDFAASMHGPEPAQPGSTLYSIAEPVLRMRILSVASNENPAREIDFSDGTRKHFSCVDKCDDPQDAQWNLDWIADQFGNVLLIDRTPTAKRPASGPWVWTYREGRLLNAESRPSPYYSGSADLSDFQLVRQHIATFNISHSPWEYRLTQLELSAFTPATASARRAVYVFHYADDTEIYRDTVFPWTHPNLRVPYSHPDGRIAVSTLTSIDLPNSGSGGSSDSGNGSGPRLGRWAFSYYLGPEEPLQATQVGGTVYTSDIAGRLRKVTPPTSRNGGYEYTYVRRGYPTRPCHNPGGPIAGTAPSLFTGVASRQQLKDDGTADGNPWRYSGQSHLEPPDANGCRTPREFVAAVMDPAGTISMSFFNADINAPADYGKPFTPVEADAINHAGVTRNLSSRIFRANHYTDFAADLGGAINSVIAAYRSSPPQDISSYGSFVRSSYATYEDSYVSCGFLDPTGNCVHKYLRRASEHTRYDDDSQHAADAYTESIGSDYDGLGHYRRMDWFGNFAQLGLGTSNYEQRTNYTWFNPAVTYTAGTTLPAGAPAANQPWLIEKYDSQAVSEGGRTLTTRLAYDAARAYITQKRVCEKTTGADAHFQVPLSTKDLITNITRTEGNDSAGPLTIVTEEHLGGDLQASATEYKAETAWQFGAVRKRLFRGCVGEEFYIAEQNQIDPNSGVARSFADSAGVATTYDYDRMGRVISVTPQGEAAQTYAYTTATSFDPPDVTATNSLAITRNGAQVSGTTLAYTFDQLGRLSKESQTLPAGTNQKNYKYDLLGRVTNESITADSAPPADSLNTTTYIYDPLGRVSLITRPDNTTTTEEYFGARLVNHKVSDVAILPAPQTVVTTDFFDSFGRVARVNDNAARADYDYDPAGRLLAVTTRAAGDTTIIQRRFFDYDGRGLLVGERHPELSINFGANSFVEVHHSYDSMGLPVSLRYINNSAAANAFDLDYDYDAAGRLTDLRSAHIPQGANTPPPVKHFTYYPQNNGGATAGKPSSATRYTYTFDPAATNTPLTYTVRRDFNYDPATGRPASIKVTSPNSNFAATTSFGYDDLGEASRVTYGVPSSPMSVNAPARVAGNRFNRGFLIGVDYGTTTPSTRLLNLGYHATGIVNDVCFGSGAGCASHDVISIDKKGIARPGSIQWTWSGGGATTGTYAYDGAGNISGMDTDAFAYDKSGRLVQAKIGALQQSYSYDAAGNLKSMPAGATVDSNTNRLSTATYDGAGNVKSLPDLRPMVRRNDPTAMLNFRYDYSGEQVWFGASGISRSFIYDDQDERVAVIDAKAGQPKHERWSVRDLDKKVIRDFDRTNAVWSWTKDFLYRDATAAGTISMNGSVEELHQLHADHLGTVRIVTTSTGALYGGAAGAYPQKYWPFGDPVISATLADRLVFTGHERDDDGTLDTQADIDYMHARYYAPVAGRFLSPDRVNGKPETPQSWNRYSYTLNSPLRYVDPNGKQAAPPPVVLIGSGADLKVAVPSTPGGMYNPTSAEALKEWELGIEGISPPKSGWSSVRMAKELGANVLKYHINGIEVRHVGPKPSVFRLLYEDRIPYAFEVAADNLAVGTKAAYKTTAKVVAGTANASLKLIEFLGTAPGQAVLMFFDAKPAGYTADNPDPAGIEQYQPEEYRDKKK